MTPRKLRVALLTHSTNPRGGVVHALELAEALTDLGHEAVVHAPDPSGRGFFRAARCELRPIPALKVGDDLASLVAFRVADYVAWFSKAENRGFDVWHAGDGISANALANLREAGLIPAFARTVHHIDDFDDPRVEALQARAITAPDAHFVVSQEWRERLLADWGIDAEVVGNGVDTRRFSPCRDAADEELAASLLPPGGPVFLAVGGIEERKNTVRILEAFRLIHASEPAARLVVAGGASLLDHSAYRRAFDAVLAAGRLEEAVIVTGPMPQRLMAPLYRAADALVFPSLKEGFGLVALEAMACGTPVIVSVGRPFDDWLEPGEALRCDPASSRAIAAAMARMLGPSLRADLAARGPAVAARHSWRAVAERHLGVYEALPEIAHA